MLPLKLFSLFQPDPMWCLLSKWDWKFIQTQLTKLSFMPMNSKKTHKSFPDSNDNPRLIFDLSLAMSDLLPHSIGLYRGNSGCQVFLFFLFFPIFSGFLYFLSHLLVAGCDIGVRFSVRPSLRLSTFMLTFDIYVKVSILINYKTKQPTNLAWNISLTPDFAT